MTVPKDTSSDTTTDEQPPQSSPATSVTRRPKRAYHHKVRTGCYTCRKRRIKCDEAKPVCKTCTKNGSECRGYSKIDPVRLVVVPPPSSPHGRNEQQAFQFFMETTMTWFHVKTGPSMMESHTNEFWDPVVLQMTEAEPAIKHILLAWAELHRRILYEPVTPDEPIENDFFWQNHSQALWLLGSNKQIDTSVMLIACVMFCIMENFRGRRDLFLRHLQPGLKILHDYEQAEASKTNSICDNMITRYVRPMLLAFKANLVNILEFDPIQPKVKDVDQLVKMKQASRVVKSWN